MRIIGYMADASIYCPDCANEIYIAHCAACGQQAEHITQNWHNYDDCLDQYLQGNRADDWTCFHGGNATPGRGAFIAIDNEKNEVHPIFSTDEQLESEYCHVCYERIE